MTRRFSVVELMMVVAVMSVLAAIAVPMFANMQTNARLVEPELTVDALWPVVLASHEEGFFDAFPSLDWSTGAVPRSPESLDRHAVPWGLAPEGAEKFKELGFEPTAATRCTYAVQGSSGYVRLTTHCDLNGDGIRFDYELGYTEGSSRGPYSVKVDCPVVWKNDLPLDRESMWTDPMWSEHDFGWDNHLVQTTTCR